MRQVAEGTLRLEWEVDPTVHIAMQQNAVPVVKTLRVTNLSATTVGELEIQIRSDPEFCPLWTTHVAEIQPGGTCNLPPPDLKLSADYLLKVSEKVRSRLLVKICSAGNPILQEEKNLEVLSPDEWSGLRSLPEILAAFSMPNHPTVEKLLQGAAQILQKNTGDSAMDGYQRKSPEHVARITAAIFQSIHLQGIHYINPPACFETEGQKIRFPDRILNSKLGTCLDLSLLCTSCLEQVGLHPLIVFTTGHAFPGVWLVEESFADPLTDDLARLRKRIDLGEMLVFESTQLTQPSAPFETALRVARTHLSQDESFRGVIDIHRCRKSRILPLPFRVTESGIEIMLVDETTPPQQEKLPDLELPGKPVPEAASETPATRLDRWKRRLLDLTLNNRLINFRETSKTIPLLAPSLQSLENALSEGDQFRILPHINQANDPRSQELYSRQTGNDLLREQVEEEFRSHRLHSTLQDNDLSRRLVEVYRSARAALEEGGASSLYLALGFLSWYETPQSPQRRLAPIILIPIEVERRSIQEGFHIRQGDEDPMVNITLLELLQKDFSINLSGLDPIPVDEQGIGVESILATFRQAIKEIPRWDVLEDAWIGMFSFTKYLMWRDLQERSQDLLKNRLVSHLVNTPNEPFSTQGAFPEVENLDQTFPLTETYCPLSSDSSQLAAVYAAAAGNSFVLEGPPGTGKSQTITNLIAHALCTGKRVLFVAEKIAALNVVYSRLRQCGLERFCLELHSNKSHKMEVLQQLGQSLEKLESRSTSEWEHEARKLESLRSELNRYVQAMHRPQALGQSLYEGLSQLIGYRDYPAVPLAWQSPETTTRETLDQLLDVIDRLKTSGQASGHPRNHPWCPVGVTEWSPAFQREVERSVTALQQSLVNLEKATQAINLLLGYTGEGWSLEGQRTLSRLLESLLQSPGLLHELLQLEDWSRANASLGHWVQQGRRSTHLKTGLLQRFKEGLFNQNATVWLQRLEQIQPSFVLIRWFRKRALLKELRPFQRDTTTPDLEQLRKDFTDLAEWQTLQEGFQSIKESATRILGAAWKAGDTDWQQVEQSRLWCEDQHLLTQQLSGFEPNQAQVFLKQISNLLTASKGQPFADTPAGKQASHYVQCWSAWEKECRQLAELLQLDSDQAFGAPAAGGYLATVSARLAMWQTAFRGLQSWCNWQATVKAAQALHLDPLLNAYQDGKFVLQDIKEVFLRGFYEWWVESLIDQDVVLKQFYSPEQERRIEQFRILDQRYLELTRELIQACLGARMPKISERVAESSEMGILQRELQKKRKQLPIRQLFQKIPNLLPRLKPCLLMSPISVAQYLDAGHAPFDLVVFDEASQIPTWDAVGAIARGEEVVIVGDPKQLPPTNFFSRSNEEEDLEEDQIEDLESILDDCIGARVPWLQLRWHYRSRHESLIAFSNHRYYDSRLLTFPSPFTGTVGVSLRPINGLYEKGRSRTNRAEAEAIVQEILNRLSDPVKSRHSIGVVTFNLQQQTLVEDLLDEARRNHPEIEPFFNPDNPDAVFVKNLENVQGDERDVILFSICYGPDEQGRISMNFGPLNRDGGERRLNVAITRARREVVVFATLRPDQIDLTRTRAKGVADLKLFLDYAERGPVAISEAMGSATPAGTGTPFENQVCQKLREKGYEVHQQIGCSGYRIDLAVVDPERPDQYLLGIECDGANYCHARTARDRDQLRSSVLTGLGWKLHRIWIHDWWYRPEETLEKIEQAIHVAIGEKKQKALQDTPPGTPAPPTPAAVKSDPPPSSSTPIHDREVPPQPEQGELRVYTPFPLEPVKGTSEDFYANKSSRQILRLVNAVLVQEAPVSLDLLARRVAAHWDINRITPRVVERVKTVAMSLSPIVTCQDQTYFVWLPGSDPMLYEHFRIPGEDPEERRDAEDLPVEEVANGVHYLMKQAISVPLEDLLAEVGKLFGFSRKGNSVREKMNAGVEYLNRKGKIRIEEGRVYLVEEAAK